MFGYIGRETSVVSQPVFDLGSGMDNVVVYMITFIKLSSTAIEPVKRRIPSDLRN